jgi:hypothetical protein
MLNVTYTCRMELMVLLILNYYTEIANANIVTVQSYPTMHVSRNVPRLYITLTCSLCYS